MIITNLRENLKTQLKADLARLLDCDPAALPATAPKDIGAKFLRLKNPKTLNVWNCEGSHGIVMLKIGRRTEPTTDWLIDFALSGLSVAGEVA